jgi:hypothetical protein
MINNYDPNYSFGEHTVQVTIQQWQYKGTLKVKVGGNCKGMSVMEGIADVIYDQANTLESDCNFTLLEADEDDDNPWFAALLKDNEGNELRTESEWDDLERAIVAVQIIDFVPKN